VEEEMNLHVNEVSPPPEWLLELVNKVHNAIEPLSLMGQLGYRWLSPESSVNVSGVWVLGVYPCANEIRGGRKDGAIIHPGFRLNISSFLSGFSSIGNMAWIHPTVYNGSFEGPRLCVEGTYSEHKLRLQIFAVAPTDEDASLIIDMASGDWWQKQVQDG
jgi:hypothetical protein|tara:strand:+ start:644 stop:1123 length:480 start_codon:yes stop_codon:yes gene_type:complete